MSLESIADTMHHARNVQKNWSLGTLATTFRLHLRPRPSDKPESWPAPMWQVLDQISTLIPEYRGHVAFLEKVERLWRDDERVRASGVTTQDLKDVLVYFQGLVHVSEQDVEESNNDAKEMIAIENGIRNIEGSEGIQMDRPDDTVESSTHINQISLTGSPTASPSHPRPNSGSLECSGSKRSSPVASETDSDSDSDSDSTPARKRSRQKSQGTTPPKSADAIAKPNLILGFRAAWKLDSVYDVFADPKMCPSGLAIRWSWSLLRALYTLSQKTADFNIIAVKMKESFDTRVAQRMSGNKKSSKKVLSSMKASVEDVRYAEKYVNSLMSDSDSERESSSSHSSPHVSQLSTEDSKESDKEPVNSAPPITPLATALHPPRLPPSFVPQKQGLLAHAERSVHEARLALVAERADLSAAIQGLSDIVADVVDTDACLTDAYSANIAMSAIRTLEDQLRKVLDDARDRMRLVGLAENRRNVCRRDLKDKEEHVVRTREEEERKGM